MWGARYEGARRSTPSADAELGGDSYVGGCSAATQIGGTASMGLRSQRAGGTFPELSFRQEQAVSQIQDHAQHSSIARVLLDRSPSPSARTAPASGAELDAPADM
jgi:hypothetical protein